MLDAAFTERALLVTCLVLVGITLGLSLELPGKMRLNKRAYETVQPIYYPGFALGGAVGELGGILALGVLLARTPAGSPRFVWVLAAFAFQAAVHLVYWIVTHPVNNFWLKDTDLSRYGSAFFSLFASVKGMHWKTLRDVWEYSHVARAALATLAFLSLAVAATG